VLQQTIGESIVHVSKRMPWQPRISDALLAVSFFLIGFFSASGEATTDQDRTELQKPETPVKHIIVLIEAS
jgi:hypothetical protein